jgi:CheY-like chemotaxis protein
MAQVPIIAMTANVLSDQIGSFRAAGMDGHVAKPIDQRELVRVMEQVLASSAGEEGVGVTQHGDVSFEVAVYQNALELLTPAKLKKHLRSLDAHLAEVLSSEAADPEVRQLAHVLVSHAGMLGFVEVSRRCDDLQNAKCGTNQFRNAHITARGAAQEARAKLPHLIASL